MIGRSANREGFHSRRFSIRVFPAVEPEENLALEESLFAEYDTESGCELLLLYANSPSVIFGKHQNPWKESNVSLLYERGIPLLRRCTGGGTVFHDHGNVNWSFIGPKKGFSQEENLEIVRAVVSSMSGIPLEHFSISDRGDLLCNDCKISGNALAFKGERSMHHGTLLVNSDLGGLSESLRGLERRFSLQISGPGVDSNPSQVTNLAVETGVPAFEAGCGRLRDAFEKYLSAENVEYTSESQSAEAVDGNIRNKYGSSEWHLKRTPPFSIIMGARPDFQIRVKNGIAREDRTNSQWDLSVKNEYMEFEKILRMRSTAAAEQ